MINNQKQQIINLMEGNADISWRFHQEDLLLTNNNIKQKRQLVHLFITISSGIIGGLLLFKESVLIQNIRFVYSGITFLFFVILYGFYYLVHILTFEGKLLEKQRKRFRDGFKNIEKQEIKFLENPNTENEKAVNTAQKEFHISVVSLEGEIENKDKKFQSGLWLVFFSFFLGLICLALSIIRK